MYCSVNMHCRMFILLVVAVIVSCKPSTQTGQTLMDQQEKKIAPKPDWEKLREQMVEQQIKGRDVKDPNVLDAMLKVPRHLFIPKPMRSQSYADHPVPIGEGQTISQPYIVAFMSELLAIKGSEKVLEIGTGSGYQAAVLAEMGAIVYTIEIVQALAERAEQTLTDMGYTENMHVKWGDGYKGWPEHAPFDAVIVTCAPEDIPEPLVEQLAVGGRIVIPVGPENMVQELAVVEKVAEGEVNYKPVIPVRFVPMTRDVR